MTEAENKVRLARQLVRASIEMLELATADVCGTLSHETAVRVDSSLSRLRDVNLDLVVAQRHEIGVSK
jgi:hypothetical protein